MSDEALRYNDGKLRLGLVPASIWFARWGDTQDEDLREMLMAMRQFQEGDDDALMRFFAFGGNPDHVEEMVRVLEFGAQKYAAWNWAKGLPYSNIFDSFYRHCAYINNGIDRDAESGLTHYGHAYCNMMFLAYYQEKGMTEFDDRPPA